MEAYEYDRKSVMHIVDLLITGKEKEAFKILEELQQLNKVSLTRKKQ